MEVGVLVARDPKAIAWDDGIFDVEAKKKRNAKEDLEEDQARKRFRLENTSWGWHATDSNQLQ